MAWRCLIGRHWPGPPRLDAGGATSARCVECLRAVTIRAQLAPDLALLGRQAAARAQIAAGAPHPRAAPSRARTPR